MVSVLVIAEHDGKNLNLSTAKTLNAAFEVVADAVDILVCSDGADTVCEQAARLKGIRKVYHISRSENSYPIAALIAPQVVAMAESYTHVFAPATTFGKDVMPRVAALSGVTQVSEIMSVIDARTFTRPIYAGNAIATVQVEGETRIIATVRSASFTAVSQSETSVAIENINSDVDLPSHSRFIELEQSNSDSPDLQSAGKVVTGGRGLASADNFVMIHALASALGAAVGATRAAVDAGYASNDMQVGQTGKTVAPDLYLAVGVSGAIQHLAGIKDARTIVAINKDPDAPIFDVADIGLVADLFDVLPELKSLLS